MRLITLLFLLPVFTLNAQTPLTDTLEKKKPVMFAERMPSFPGGEAELRKYLSKNIRYPADLRKAGIEGTVVAQFVVEEDGSVSGVKILRDIGGGAAAEVARVILAMPDWTPGELNGVNVPVYFNLPVTFAFSGGKKEKGKKSKRK